MSKEIDHIIQKLEDSYLNSKFLLKTRTWSTNHQELIIVKNMDFYNNVNSYYGGYYIEATDYKVFNTLLTHSFFKTKYFNRAHAINDFNNFCYTYDLDYKINTICHKSTDYTTEDSLWSIDKSLNNKWHALIGIRLNYEDEIDNKANFNYLIKDLNLDDMSRKFLDKQIYNLLNDYYYKTLNNRHSTRKYTCKTSLEIFKKCYQEKYS